MYFMYILFLTTAELFCLQTARGKTLQADHRSDSHFFFFFSFFVLLALEKQHNTLNWLIGKIRRNKHWYYSSCEYSLQVIRLCDCS